MEEKIKLELQLASSSMEDCFREEEFYEEIEAPKFVDFTHPHHFDPDDRYWFCSRVGCDQRHEQEMDPEAIYKNFVLRVMAARSPNVRLRKALSRRPAGETKKCPFSAPPKSSKSRLPRLAIASSISKKLVLDEKRTNKPHPTEQKPCSTPKARVKHVAAKYMTSVRKKKVSSPNPNAFRSVRNLNRSITLPKTKVVAKALSFNSPKKAQKKVKAPEGLTTATPITKLCEGMKKMKITQKPSKECTSVRKGLPSNALNKQPSSSRKNETKLCRSVKSKSKKNDEKKGENVIHEAKTGDELSDMEVDGKPRAAYSLESRSGMKSKVENNESEEKSRSSGCGSSQIETTVSGNTQTSEVISFPESEDRVSAQADPLPFEKAKGDDQRKRKNNNSSDCDIENQNPRLVDELTNNDRNIDDGLNSDNIISENISNLNGGNLSKHDAPVKQKIKTVDKSSKENCSAATQGVKYRKLKPTNPKPFRLRTDERGILKEATLERKANSNENASENLQSGNELSENNREKQSKKELDKSFKQDQIRPVKSKYLLSTSKSVKAPAPCSVKRTNPPREKVLRMKFGQSTVEESKARILKPKEPRMKSSKIVANPTHKLPAQGRRAGVTIPREPNFQGLRKPKSCTRNTE